MHDEFIPREDLEHVVSMAPGTMHKDHIPLGTLTTHFHMKAFLDYGVSTSQLIRCRLE